MYQTSKRALHRHKSHSKPRIPEYLQRLAAYYTHQHCTNDITNMSDVPSAASQQCSRTCIAAEGEYITSVSHLLCLHC